MNYFMESERQETFSGVVAQLIGYGHTKAWFQKQTIYNREFRRSHVIAWKVENHYFQSCINLEAKSDILMYVFNWVQFAYISKIKMRHICQ